MHIHAREFSEHFSLTFKHVLGLDSQEYARLIAMFRRELIPHKGYFFKGGEVCRRIGYINKGSTRTFTTDEKGHEHILYFSFEDYLLGDQESLYTGEPGIWSIQAVEDCELFVINKADLDALEASIPKLHQWHMNKQFRNHFAMLHLLAEIKSMSHEQRYCHLIDSHPQVFQRVPLQYIASYLDMEPQSLSRMRKRMYAKLQ